MHKSVDLSFDVASALYQGKRDLQEDALASDFSKGAQRGFVVLSDGLGGHEAGDVASKIVVNEVFTELKLRSAAPEALSGNTPEILERAAKAANACVQQYIQVNPASTGMGATLVATVLQGDRLFWISIGDSPLMLFRDGDLRQLNADHSFASSIDFMVKSGLIPELSGQDHPERNLLTSALIGEDIPQIDCPQDAFQLLPGDILIVCSDGLQFLSNGQIRHLLAAKKNATSAQLADLLLTAIDELDHPEQDNVGFSVIRVKAGSEGQATLPGKTRRDVEAVPAAAQEPNGARLAPGLAAKVVPFLSKLFSFNLSALK